MKKKTFLDFAKFCIEKQKSSSEYIDTYFCSFAVENNNNYALNISNRVYKGFRKICNTHSESRLAKNHNCKEIFVVRTRKLAPFLLMAKPCPLCQTFLKNKKIKTVYYSIDNDSYGIFYPQTNNYIVKKFRG